MSKHNSSWQPVSRWYNKVVGDKGHYFHEHVVIPNTLRLLNLDSDSHLLDLACGQGVLERAIPKTIKYTGIDLSSDLINSANGQKSNPLHKFITDDVTSLSNAKWQMANTYTHACIILALQNIDHPDLVFKNAAKNLTSNGKFLIVLNHPIFRIPKLTSWGIDEQNKLQYRRINRYLTPQKIPITAHPGEKNSPTTWSFHHPLSDYFKYLNEAGFLVENLEEWISDKVSVGSAAKMENLARTEFPLFMAILATKK